MVHEIRVEIVGNVLRIESTEGDRVDEGDVLLVVESMKMEIPVPAEASGTVLSLPVEVGTVVQRGEVVAVVATAEG